MMSEQQEQQLQQQQQIQQQDQNNHRHEEHHERQERREQRGGGWEGGGCSDRTNDDDDDDDPYIEVYSVSAEEGAREIPERRTSSSSSSSSSSSTSSMDGGGLDGGDIGGGGSLSFSPMLSPGWEDEFGNKYVVTNDDDDNKNDDNISESEDDGNDHDSGMGVETSLAWCTSLTNSSSHNSPTSTYATARRNEDVANNIHDGRICNIHEDGRDNQDDDDYDDEDYDDGRGHSSKDNDNHGDGSEHIRLHHHRSHHTNREMLKCAAIGTIPSSPSPHASPPPGGGNAASDHHDNNHADDEGNVIKTPCAIVMPRFYDSEDDYGVGGGSVVFVDTPSSAMTQTSPQVCYQTSNNNTINSNASGASMAERTSIRNLFMQNIERQMSSGSVVRWNESPSYQGVGDQTEEEDCSVVDDDDDDMVDNVGSDDDEIIVLDEEFSPPHLMPYQQRKRLSARGLGEEGGAQRQLQPAGVAVVLPNDVMTTPPDALAVDGRPARGPPHPPKTAAVVASTREYGNNGLVGGVGGNVDVSGIHPSSSSSQMKILNVETDGHRQQERVILPPSPLSPSPPSPQSPSPPSQHQNQPSILASKYRVAAIPPFRGRGASTASQNLKQQRHTSDANSNSSPNGDADSLGGRGRETMRKIKSAMASSNATTASPSSTGNGRSPERRTNQQHRSDRAQQQMRSNSIDGNRPPRAPLQHPHPQQQQQQQHHQETIHSHFPPLTSQHSPISPRGGVDSGGYHIRINSQGSVSSLGSNAAGADDAVTAAVGGSSTMHHAGMQPAMLHADSREQRLYMQQQKKQQEQLWQQHHKHHAPVKLAHQQQQQLHPNYNVNYNALLGREVAQFLHGEHVAKAVEKNKILQQQHHRQDYQNQQRHLYDTYGPQAPPLGWNPPHYNASPQRYQPQQYGWYTGSHEHLNQHIRVFTPPTTWDANSKDFAHHNLYQRQAHLPSESEDEGDDDLDPLISKSKYVAGVGDEDRRKSGSQQRRQMELNRYESIPPLASLRGQNDLGQFPSNQRSRYNHTQQQGDAVHWNDRSISNDPRRPQQPLTDAHIEESFPGEKSSLLHGGGNYFQYRMDNDLEVGGGGRIMMPQHHGMPPRNALPSEGAPLKSSNTKRKSKRRKHHKEKHRNIYPSESSGEEERFDNRYDGGSISYGRLRVAKSKKKSKSSSSSRIQNRRRRYNKAGKEEGTLQAKIDDSLSETYSESQFSVSSPADRSRTRHSKGFIRQFLISSKLLCFNLPLSFSAISFSIVLLGIAWLKYAQEILPSCKEVNFHSSQCTYSDFPGCYFCDEFNPAYRFAIQFHKVCCYTAGISALLFFFKAILCWRVFMDEMSSPTTASPSGLIFMTLALSFAGKLGTVGGILVFVASFLHLLLVVWFTYMSLAYQTMPGEAYRVAHVAINARCSFYLIKKLLWSPLLLTNPDPSWFANTIGIGLCAVKIWFYYPLAGHFLIAITLMLTFVYYPISLIRVALNDKMSATICWMNMMGPSVSLYSLAIIMEPTFSQERPDISHFQTVQRSVYLPSMTCLFGLCIIGMMSSVHGLIVRWKQIAKEEFSPAHAAYSFPLLMHAMAIQSYRSSLDFFAPEDTVSVQLKAVLHAYWVLLLVVGTFVALTCIVLYLAFLPIWVDVDTKDELEPPAPNETSICNSVTYGESLIQPYVSPTILQANETGILVMTYDYQNDWYDLGAYATDTRLWF